MRVQRRPYLSNTTRPLTVRYISLIAILTLLSLIFFIIGILLITHKSSKPPKKSIPSDYTVTPSSIGHSTLVSENSDNTDSQNSIKRKFFSLNTLTRLSAEKKLTKEFDFQIEELEKYEWEDYLRVWLPDISLKHYNKENLINQILKVEDELEKLCSNKTIKNFKNIYYFLGVYIENLTYNLRIVEHTLYLLNNLPVEYKKDKPQIMFVLGYGEITENLMNYRKSFAEKYKTIFDAILSSSEELNKRESDYFDIKEGINTLVHIIWSKENNFLYMDKSPDPEIIELRRVLQDPERLKAYVAFQGFWIYFVLFENVFGWNDEAILNRNLFSDKEKYANINETVNKELGEYEVSLLKGFIAYLRISVGFEVREEDEVKWRDMNLLSVMGVLYKILRICSKS